MKVVSALPARLVTLFALFMGRLACRRHAEHISVSVRLFLVCLISSLIGATHGQSLLLKTETFDTDPAWDGRNNRATDPAPRQIVQNFGYSSSTTNAGGAAGEIGGFITPAGEPAFYGKVITPASFNDPLSASGILNVPQGGGHTLIGFFNADTVNEWRTPNTIALRIYGRGAYIIVTLDGQAVTLNLDPGHKQIGAHFNRFGIITTHIDGSGQTVYFDDLTYTLGITPPTLTIVKTAPAQALLQWPTNYPGYRVNYAVSLRTPILWRVFTNAVTTNGALNTVSVATTNTVQFFRLRKP